MGTDYSIASIAKQLEKINTIAEEHNISWELERRTGLFLTEGNEDSGYMFTLGNQYIKDLQTGEQKLYPTLREAVWELYKLVTLLYG